MSFSSACSTIAAPDSVGLYYYEGPSDGYEFGECVAPGKTGPGEWNNSIVYLSTALRTWVIDDAPGADSNELILVSAAPQEGHPSGVQVKLATKTSFFLNTYCDDSGGKVREFWEKLGRRYDADTPDGWKRLLEAELVPTQKTIIKDVIRAYSADPLIANALVDPKAATSEPIQVQAQKIIGERLAAEFNRLAGGTFFCGPSFNRDKPDCPQLELTIIGVEYADPGIQAARNEKAKAVELAAAQLARAQGEASALYAKAEGEVNAANKLRELYNNPAWVALRKAEMQLEAVKACSVQPNCKMIMGADGNIMITP